MPEVRVPRLFTGDESKGPDLRQHLTHLDAQHVRFKATGHTDRSFFQLLGSTLDGEALNYYIHEKDRILAEPERTADGRVVRDAEGRVLLCQNPGILWAQMLHDRFRAITADKETEYDRLRQKPGSRP